jgi:hypothetical protein
MQLMQLSKGFYGTDYYYKFAKQNELRFPYVSKKVAYGL